MHFVASCIFKVFSGHGGEVTTDVETGRALVKIIPTVGLQRKTIGKVSQNEGKYVYLCHGYQFGMEGYV